jgi:DNA primase
MGTYNYLFMGNVFSIFRFFFGGYKSMDLVEAIKSSVSIYNVLDIYKISYMGDVKEQINCPFHGADVKKSARIYPDTNTVFCWTCDKVWDVIEFVKEMEDMSFGSACNLLIKRFSINIHMEDYEERFYKIKNTIPFTGDYSDVVERMFREFLGTLTNDQFRVKINEINRCWSLKDLLDKGKTSNKVYIDWLEKCKKFIGG